MKKLSWLSLTLFAWRFATSNELNFNETYFERLRNYQVNAVPVPESKYPWIARVVHSRKSLVPHLCTASCLRQQIFITAASCVYLLKVRLTSVIYNNQRLSVKAFIVPTNETKQQFDDIGTIITNDNEYTGNNWSCIKFLGGSDRRGDNQFNWYAKSGYFKTPFKIIGYATSKRHSNAPDSNKYVLTELDVVSDIRLCHEILTFKKRIQGFHVPCYHSCTYEQFYEGHENCNKYHGVEGGALQSLKYPTYIYGIATWGAHFKDLELPVGLALTNSDAFAEDYECADWIAHDKKEKPQYGYYQAICDTKNGKN